MNQRILIGAGAALTVLLIIVGSLWASRADDVKPNSTVPPIDAAADAAARFLDRYVEPDGRVVRRDQGGDTVSEGQAYAMLVAVATGDQARFDSTWNWAKANLRQPSGLMAWAWNNGRIVDPQPATDADLDAARALAVASARFDNAAYAEEARVLAKAIADNGIAYPGHGRPVLIAGPWANTAPFVVNPSYHSPRAEQLLSELTTDTRWAALMDQERRNVDELIGTGENDVRLPPDWARVSLQGAVKASGAPADAQAPAVYSYDAVRLPVRLAESCNAADRAQAARMWTLLGRSQDTRTSARLGLSGEVLDKRPTAVGAVASAASAKAAGDSDEAFQLLALADRIDADAPTYYGAAWAALGRIMLTTEWLGSCPAE